MTKSLPSKRVLFVAARLPDGGINTHMLTLGSELKRLGWEVAICSGGPEVDGKLVESSPMGGHQRFPVLAEHYEQAGIAHFPLEIPSRPRSLRDLPKLLGLLTAIWQMLRAVRRFRPSLMHLHHTSRQLGVYARLVQLLTGTPYISTIHMVPPAGSRFFARTMLLGSGVIAVSREISDIVTQHYGVDPDRVWVVLPGADASHFRPPSVEERRTAREQYGLQPDQFALAFIGSLSRLKRPDTLVEAVADLVGAGHDVVALVAGRGSQEDAIRSQATDLGVVDRVRILGHQDARNVLWASDVLVLPSESEGFPLVVTEAMLCGVAVMRTPAGDASQLTADVTGVFFAVGDHQELARKATGLLERPDLREAMTARALVDAQHRFSSESMARAIDKIYTDLLDG